jgi:DNA-binding MarR family transcriptional regulator
MGAQSVITSQVVARRFGLHTTDLECLDLIYMQGQASAGELAKATGLTSGAVTALIDRLARAGYVTRVADPNDRRRVLVRICEGAIKPIEAVYRPMQTRMFELWSSYTPDQLETVADFISRSTGLAVACAEELRERRDAAVVKKRRSQSK